MPKKCGTCEKVKAPSDFYKQAANKDGLAWNCKVCSKASVKAYENSPKGKSSRRSYNASAPRRSAQAERARTPEGKKYQQDYDNVTGRSVRVAYRATEAYRESQRKYANSIQGKLRKLLRRRLTLAVHSWARGGSAVRDLGCTIPEFRSYVEALWEPGMSWANWGCGPGSWQLDHRRPLASFDLTDPAQVRVACCFINLQPLWSEENLRKRAKYELVA